MILSVILCNVEDAAVQAIKVLNMIKVYGKPIRVNKASQDKKTMDVGSNLFIGNIDPDVDEKVTLLLATSPDLCTHTSPEKGHGMRHRSLSLTLCVASALRWAVLHGALPSFCCSVHQPVCDDALCCAAAV